MIDDGDDRETTTPAITQLSIFIGSNYIVTVHQGDLRPLRNIFDSCREDKSQRDELMGTSSSSGYLLHSIIDRLVDDLFHVLRRVVGNLRDIEDDVFNEQLAIAFSDYTYGFFIVFRFSDLIGCSNWTFYNDYASDIVFIHDLQTACVFWSSASVITFLVMTVDTGIDSIPYHLVYQIVLFDIIEGNLSWPGSTEKCI